MIAIIDYKAGNIGSLANALKRLGAEFEITADPQKIRSAAGVIFPGQGRAGPAMRSLRAAGLDGLLPDLKQPFLGVCLGMQLMVVHIEEDGEKGLGILPGSCERFKNVSPVPHMGWNEVGIKRQTPLLAGLDEGVYQYFAHSYAVRTEDKFILAVTDYGGEFASVIAKDNFYGVQFHPEKSAETGVAILGNFLAICGEKK